MRTLRQRRCGLLPGLEVSGSWPCALENGGERKQPLRRDRHQRRSFLPGHPIRETGIYEVMHDRNHRLAHEAVLHAKEVFPECDTCKDRVRFRLLRTAPYIFEDEDFQPE